VRIKRRSTEALDVFLWLPAGLLLALAMMGRVHVGIRHILPCLPLMLIGSGFALRWLLERRWGSYATGLGVAWLGLAVVTTFPHGLSYFNEWIGGPHHGWKYLGDSNIDWGQDLPALQRYVERHDIEEFNFAYFGSDITAHYFGHDKIDSLPTPFCGDCVPTKRFEPSPGIYAISVNMLLGHFWTEPYWDYFRYFRDRPPDAKAGYSIFIYNVP
jgi:hypothetical protein